MLYPASAWSLPCHILPYPAQPYQHCLTMFCLTLPCLTLPYLTLPCIILLCITLPWITVAYLSLSCTPQTLPTFNYPNLTALHFTGPSWADYIILLVTTVLAKRTGTLFVTRYYDVTVYWENNTQKSLNRVSHHNHSLRYDFFLN